MDGETQLALPLPALPGRHAADPADSNAGTRPRAGWLAVLTIVGTAALWAALVNEVLFRGDDVTWYRYVDAQAWHSGYAFQPMLFLIMSLVRPGSFNAYILCSILILLGILLFALWRMRFSPADQLIAVLFFSWSFYGLHFLLNFQRQFLAIVFLLCALPGGKQSVVWRVFSLASHQYAIVVHAFWWLRRLSTRAALIGTAVAIPCLYALMAQIDFLKDNSEGYTDYGHASFAHLAWKQAVNVVFVLALRVAARSNRELRSLATIHIVLCVPTLFWPTFAGLFNRIDYFLFPVLIVMGLHPDSGSSRRWLLRLAIALYTAVTCVLWMKLNLGWILFDMGGSW